MSWLKRSLWEIDRSSSLRVLGGLLALGQILTYVYWQKSSFLFAGSEAQPLLCWNFQSQCSGTFLSAGTLSTIFTSQLILSIAAALLFFSGRLISWAWVALMISWFVQTSVYFMDASLRSNAYALVFLIGFYLLFLPNKIRMTQYTVFAYFILDALTKLNPDWLSGIGFLGQIAAPEKGLEWLAAFSVIIQMVMPFFLISRDGQRMGYGFAALFIYQVGIFFILKDPSSLSIAAILLFFIFKYFETKRLELESLYQSYEHPEPSNIWWPVVLLIFIAAQFRPPEVLPYLEVLRLEKLQSSEECQTLFFSQGDAKIEWLSTEKVLHLPQNIKCNPQANFNALKQVCAKNKNDNGFRNLTVFFLTRAISETSYRLRFSSDRFCDSSYTGSHIGGLSL